MQTIGKLNFSRLGERYFVMDKKDIRLLKKFFYNNEKCDVISQLGKIDNPLLLHFFAANYNWNS